MTDPAAVNEFAERMAATLAAAGFPRMAARVLMALMTEEDGQATAEELGAKLGASAAAISGAVRYLQNLNIIHRLPTPGSRRQRYLLPDTAWYDATSSQAPLYAQLIGLAEKGVLAMPAGSRMARRTEDMADYFRFIRERLPALSAEWLSTREPRD